MSHFTNIQTELTDRDLLIKALRSLGHKPEVGRLMARGYLGAETPVEIRIHTKNRGYDIGFRKRGSAYIIVADWYGVADFKQTHFVQELTQHYAYHATSDKLQAQGFAIATQEIEEDGRIHLVLRRMA